MPTAEELQDRLVTEEGQEHTYEILKELREMGPVVTHSGTGGVMTTTYDACLGVYKDHDARAVGDLFAVFMSPEEVEATDGAGALSSKIVIFSNPPDHTRIRMLLQKAFTPRLVRRKEPHLRELLDQFIDDFAQQDQPDVMTHVARQYPTSVIAEILGFPIEDRNEFKPLADEVARIVAEPPNAELFEELRPSMFALREFVIRHIEEKRKNPDDALLSMMIQAEEEGDKLSEMEIVANVYALLIAGQETTTNLIGNGILAFMNHRDQWDRLVADPSLAESAVEEVVRYDAPFQQNIRLAGTDMDIAGCPG